ncbi:MAG: hypothetical protein ACLR1M_07805 [Oscillospiraceae bacterium]
MMQQIANFIVDHDPMMVLQRTHDTVRATSGGRGTRIMPTPLMKTDFACFSAMNIAAI